MAFARKWIALLLCASAMAAAPAGAVLVDAVVATVDTEAILHSEIMDEVGPYLASLQAKGVSRDEFDREMRKAVSEALDQAIENKILYREALLAGIEVPDENVEAEFDIFKQRFDTEEEFMRMLLEAGETLSDFRERMRKRIMAVAISARKRREFESGIVITESEMAQYFQDHEEQFTYPERARVRRIFLQAGKDPEARATAQRRLGEFKQRLDGGANFDALAKEHSQGPNAAEGGLIGWVQRGGDRFPELEQSIFALAEGATSDIIETRWGFHLLRIDERQEAGQAAYDEARAEIEPMLRRRYGEERYRKWIKELRKRSRVREFL